MDMPLKGITNSPILNSNELILDSKNENIRLFKVNRNASLSPEHDVEGQWEEANPNTVGNFSAVGYLFAKKIQETLKVPIGIISSCWGGSKIKAWSSKDSLKKFDFIDFSAELPLESNKKRETSTVLYNAMIHPFLGFNIKGVLWYQGESDRFEYEHYRELFPSLINSWRKEWNLDYEFPFYYVQIAPYNYSKRDTVKKPYSALLREVQMQALSKIENTEMVVSADVGDCNDIHPSRKQEIANRLAYVALNKDYNYTSIRYKSPIYKSILIKDNYIEVFFDELTSTKGNGLNSFGQGLRGFFIAGKDKKFYPAEAFITKKQTLGVFSKQVKHPIAVRYGFENCFKAVLFNISHLPASPFRTDQWDLED